MSYKYSSCTYDYIYTVAKKEGKLLLYINLKIIVNSERPKYQIEPLWLKSRNYNIPPRFSHFRWQ